MNFNIFKRNTQQEAKVENRSEGYNPFAVPEWMQNMGLLFGDLDTLSFNSMSLSAVFAAVELISNSVAEIPIFIKRISKDGKDIDDNHILNKVFKSGLQSKYIFMKMLISDMLLKGNGFAYIKRAGDGTVTELIYCEPSDVTINWNKEKRELTYTIAPFGNKRIKPKDMIHLYKNSYNGYEGRGILHYASKSLDLSKNTETAASNYFKKGCNVNGLLTIKGNANGMSRTDIMKSWEAVHGAGKSGLAVLKGDMEYQSVSSNSKDAQLIETRIFNISEVARFFNISPVLLADLSHSSYSTIEASNIEFLVHTLLPYVELVQEEFNRKLLKEEEQGKYIIDLEEAFVNKADKNTMANYLKTLTSAGILSINEARHMLGFGNIENGDEHIIPYTNINNNTIDKNIDEVANEE